MCIDRKRARVSLLQGEIVKLEKIGSRLCTDLGRISKNGVAFLNGQVTEMKRFGLSIFFFLFLLQFLNFIFLSLGGGE